ncbi:MAG: hypothetical protein SU899_04225 [Chloroflexota bacterium]|nr:hypothetical protein [Chloroflexota bacterium]
MSSGKAGETITAEKTVKDISSKMIMNWFFLVVFGLVFTVRSIFKKVLYDGVSKVNASVAN